MVVYTMGQWSHHPDRRGWRRAAYW